MFSVIYKVMAYGPYASSEFSAGYRNGSDQFNQHYPERQNPQPLSPPYNSRRTTLAPAAARSPLKLNPATLGQDVGDLQGPSLPQV